MICQACIEPKIGIPSADPLVIKIMLEETSRCRRYKSEIFGPTIAYKVAKDLFFCADCDDDLNFYIDLWCPDAIACDVHSSDSYETVPPGAVVKKLVVKPSCGVCHRFFSDYVNLVWGIQGSNLFELSPRKTRV